MTYRYFRDPHHFSTYSPDPQPCGLCGETRPGYDGPFYGKGELDFVCEECLASGALAEAGQSTNEGDISRLRQQVCQLHPHLGPAEVEDLVQKRDQELGHQTPLITTWQYFFWPAHCGDYCCYVKEVGQPELNRLAGNGDGKAFFATHLIEPMENAGEIWEDIRKDVPKDTSVSYSLAVYLFQCVHCGTHLFHWDCD